MSNRNLAKAKRAKNDEFYTQLADIEREVSAYIEYDKDVFRDKTILLPCDDPECSNFTKYFAQNFVRFGLKKLISTSYTALGNPNPHGKIFTLTRDTVTDGRADFQDLEWGYLEGDGDFRSKELQKLIEESDIVITNPPFSLFRGFLKWITENDKKFLIIGGKNVVTYKDVFGFIRAEIMWLGHTNPKEFVKPDGSIQKFGNICWFTNLDHGRRHQPLQLMTEADNIKYSRHKEVCDTGYLKYDNYDAIEVPFTDAIPSDYRGVMGVPISFLGKYCPDQFKIVGASRHNEYNMDGGYWKGGASDATIQGKQVYKRILIKHINPA